MDEAPAPGLSSLKVLTNHREALLWAEVGALIHNIGKQSAAFLFGHARDNADLGEEDRQKYRDFEYEAAAGIRQAHLAKLGNPSAPIVDVARFLWLMKQLPTLPGASGNAAEFEAKLRDTMASLDHRTTRHVGSAATLGVLSDDTRKLLAAQTITLPEPFAGNALAVGEFVEFQWSRFYRDVMVGKQKLKEFDRDVFVSGSRPNEHLGSVDIPLVAAFQNNYLPLHLLQIAHGWASATDKPGGPSEGIGRYVLRDPALAPAPQRQLFRSSVRADAFGYESGPIVDQVLYHTCEFDEALRQALAAGAAGRRDLLGAAARHLGVGIADTQRPINEVTVLDHGTSAAAMLKPLLAQVILDHSRGLTNLVQKIEYPSSDGPKERIAEDNVRLRLLAIRADGLRFMASSNTLRDVEGRRAAFSDGLNAVQTLLEHDIPIANEVYRDEQGSIFVVPDICDLLDWTCETSSHGTPTLRDAIRHAFLQATSDEIDLVIGPLSGSAAARSQPSQHPLDDADDSLTAFLPTAAEIGRPVPAPTPPTETMRHWWQKEANTVVNPEPCLICGVRPRARPRPATPPGLCDTCRERRGRRSRDWLTAIHADPGYRAGYDSRLGERSIWLDEIADHNGGLALIVGAFALQDWLGGDLIETIRISQDDKGLRKQGGKGLSFARFRRIWETTARFWQVTDSELFRLGGPVPAAGPRIYVYSSEFPSGDVIRSMAYTLCFGSVAIPVVWDAEHGYFISTGNLLGLSRRHHLELESQTCVAAASTVVNHILRCENGILVVEDEVRGGVAVQVPFTVEYADVISTPGTNEPMTYQPVIPILAEPQRYMAIVPAASAMAVMDGIVHRYHAQMARVQDRLALNTGILFFRRRDPLSNVLDAGRRLLERPVQDEQWRVASVTPPRSAPTPTPEVGAVPPGTGPTDWSLRFVDGTTWRYPIKMGDGTTDDVWYPYLRLVSQGVDQPANALAHISDLTASDCVTVSPSRVHLGFLDRVGQRFGLGEGQGDGMPVIRQHQGDFLFNDYLDIPRLWAALTDGEHPLSMSQLRQLRTRIELKREAWRPAGISFTSPAETIFERHVEMSLADAGEQWWPSLDTAQQNLVRTAALSGSLSDILRLYLNVLDKSPGQKTGPIQPEVRNGGSVQ